MTRTKVAVAVGATAALATAGTHIAYGLRRKLVVERHRLELDGWPRMRIAHLTDVHIGRGTSPSMLEHAVSAVWQVRPDVVALTGDYLNLSLAHRDKLSWLAAALPRPCVATLGNHDHWSGADAIASTLEAEGVAVLRNASVRLPCRRESLTVVGIDDEVTRHADPEAAFEGVADPARALVLTHYPLTAEAAARRGAGLVLAGHTHGNLAMAPRATALAARFRRGRYLHGLYSIGGSTLHVGGGLGSFVPGLRGRTSASPEVAVIDVSGSAEPR